MDISATGEATLSDVKIAGGDDVSINAETVTVTDNKGIISDMGSVKVIGSNGLVSITDGKVSAATEVELGGTLGTSIDGVEIDGKSISVGISGDTTIGNNSTLDAMGDIDVVGDSVEITDTSIDSTMGMVTIKGSTTTTTLTNTSVNGKDISIYGETQTTLTDSNVDATGYVEIAGQETSITGGSVSADGNVTIQGTVTAELSDTIVSGDAVDLVGGDITVVNGSTVDAIGGDITVDADSLTVGTLVLTVFGSAFNGIYLLPKFAQMLMPLEAILEASAKVNSSITSIPTLVFYAVVPLNLIKGISVSLLTMLLYKRVARPLFSR